MIVDGQLDAPGLGRAVWITDVGHFRKRNEDRLLVKNLWDGQYLLLLVADGAGGHESGDKAAEEAVITFDAFFSAEGDVPGGEPSAWLREAMLLAHSRVKGLSTGGFRPPASTIVGLLVERASLCGWRFHIGDSRLYGCEPGGEVESWTRDHNILNGLIDRGLPIGQAKKIAEGGRLTQILGGGTDPEPEVRGPLRLHPGQCFLLASDGVFGHNAERDVLSPAMAGAEGELEDRAQQLKGAVLEGEAPDNLTAVLWVLPADSEATQSRETVSNTMAAVTPDDIALALAAEELADDADNAGWGSKGSSGSDRAAEKPISSGGMDSGFPGLLGLPGLVAATLLLAVVLSAFWSLSAHG